jgi:hypothetical protein
MLTLITLPRVAALHSNTAATEPSTIPPAPASGVILCPARARSASSAPPAAPPCAAFWPRAEAAATLRASQVHAVAADEIDWLHEHTDDETDPACVLARAAIEAWLRELSPEHRLAIALHHDPLPWPDDLPGHEEDSYALVSHLVWPTTNRDLKSSTPEQLARRARRVAIAIERDGAQALRTLIRRARWAFADAVRAYAEVRGRAPSAVPAGLEVSR